MNETYHQLQAEYEDTDVALLGLSAIVTEGFTLLHALIGYILYAIGQTVCRIQRLSSLLVPPEILHHDLEKMEVKIRNSFKLVFPGSNIQAYFQAEIAECVFSPEKILVLDLIVSMCEIDFSYLILAHVHVC
jgi:hypothetical protein